MPTIEQLKTLYQIGFWLTYRIMQPIVLMCIDPALVPLGGRMISSLA